MFKGFSLLVAYLMLLCATTLASKTFLIEISPNTTRAKMGITLPPITIGDSIRVNGKYYSITKNNDGNYCITVEESADGTYQAVWGATRPTSFVAKGGITKVWIPYSQFYKSTINNLASYPLYASTKTSEENRLVFADGYALLDLVVKAKNIYVSSIRVENTKEEKIAGPASYSYPKQSLQTSEGKNFVVLNTTNAGKYVRIMPKGEHFYIPILPGNYTEGLKVRICDNIHKMMEFSLSPTTLQANEVVTAQVEYQPDKNLIYFEGFDNLVWGGDYSAGSAGYGYAPVSTTPSYNTGIKYTGYEEALTRVSYNAPATGFLQSNTWDDVNGKTLSTSHQVTESYLKSRNLYDFKYLFRCQEYSGYMGIAKGSDYRGILQTGNLSNCDSICNAEVMFDFCPNAFLDDDISVQINNGGIIRSVFIDEKEIDLADVHCGYEAVSSRIELSKKLFSIATAHQNVKKWHKIKLRVEHFSSGSRLYLAGATTPKGSHAFFIDNIEVRKLNVVKKGNLRLLYWNIQNGMWGDQQNNYNNFAKWVRSLNPDICIWCEARSNHPYMETSNLPDEKSYLPNKYESYDTNLGWVELAERYGHKYTALGGHRDNFPQEITSKYPIKTLLKITKTDDPSKPIAHGGSIQQIDFNGTKINFVTLHPWPQRYGYGVSSANQEASQKANEGDYYREYEMNYILDHTILSPEYTDTENWILAGDLNSKSRLDNWFYGYKTDTCAFLCQDAILNKTNLVDVIANFHKGKFMSSLNGNSRIDYVYATPSLYQKVQDAFVVVDDWTTIISANLSNYSFPSDHRPILVDFQIDSSPSGIFSSPQIKPLVHEVHYDMQGNVIPQSTRGIHIVKQADGKSRKIIIK